MTTLRKLLIEANKESIESTASIKGYAVKDKDGFYLNVSQYYKHGDIQSMLIANGLLTRTGNDRSFLADEKDPKKIIKEIQDWAKKLKPQQITISESDYKKVVKED